MEKEIWKPVVGYEGYYEVNNLNQVRSVDRYVTHSRNSSYKFLKKGKLLKQQIMPNGYLQVTLSKNGIETRFYVHRLVAEAFLEVPDELKHLIGSRYLQINHKDEDKTNNCPENLEYCVHKYNCNYGTRNKRQAKAISKPILQYDLEGNFIKEWNSLSDTERIGGYISRLVLDCCKGKRKYHRKYKWYYK